MKARDARSLPAAAQEELRRRAVEAVKRGMSQTKAAELLGVARGTVNGWLGRYRRQGWAALKAKPRGRPRKPRLAPKKAERAVRLVLTRCPDQLKLPFVLWTREAVQQLLAKRFGIRVSVWTVGRYLRSWGLTPQKPLRRAYEQDPVAVERWLEEEYPAIWAQAQREDAEIHWADEMGVRSDHQAGRSYGLRGHTPVIPGTGRRFRCQMISAVTNRGQLAFMVFRERFTGAVFLKFLRRLIRHRSGKKVFLIVDRHPVHRAKKVHNWLAAHKDSMRLFYLPAYSPELNPDELLNQDVKTNAVGRRRPINLPEMMTTLRSYLRSTQRRPDIVQSYFHAPQVRYAVE